MTTPVVAQYPADADRGTGDTGGQFVKQDGQKPAAKSAPARPASKGKPKPKPKAKPKTAPAARPPGPPGSPRLNLKRGGQNDPAEVRNLQALLSDLKIAGVALDGQYGPSTEAAVKAAQAKLGMRPTGRASSALIRKLADAHKLSPCIKKVAAAEDVTAKFDPHQLRGPDGQWSLAGALKAMGGHEDEVLNPASGGYGDWSSVDEDGLRTFEFGDVGEDRASLDLDDDEVAQLSRELTLTQLHASNEHGPNHPHTALLHAMGDHGAVNFVDGSYFDWSTVGEDGTRTLEVSDGADLVHLDLTPDEFSEFQASVALLLHGGGDAVTAAAGHDTTAGHDELHHYWTKGEGLAKWSGSPTPWTTLVGLLIDHVGPEKAKVYASRWFIEVKGYAAGSDRNRVEHGHAPRGNNVGPG